MKAVLQNFKTGELSCLEVPPPMLKKNGIIVHNVASLVSAGTEKATITLAQMNLAQKAKARPDLVQKVLNKVKQDGLVNTVQSVIAQLNVTKPLGYSCAGIVKAVGSDINNFQPGDRVACAGAGIANHAEVVAIPRNLAVKIPDNVSFESASFVTLGAIAVHGVRQAEVTFGDNVVVLGLGLLGQLTVQICAAAGCNVFGIDIDQKKIELAIRLGARDGATPDSNELMSKISSFSRGRGADIVLLTAATKSSAPIDLAAEISRDRARVVAVGDVGLEIPRHKYYEKEIDLRLSRSYGPGRYDPSYEDKGNDYPIGYVRWTENRNMEAFLDMLASGRVRTDELITHRFPVEQAAEAYSLLDGKKQEPYIAILLGYNPDKPQPSTIELSKPRVLERNQINFGVIGAGNFAQGVLLPKLKSISDVKFSSVATQSGISSAGVAKKLGASQCTSDYKDILADENINAVLISTRHDSHATIAADALNAGKNVFVEKPLAMNAEQLELVKTAYDKSSKLLMVGFNRRFSPLAVKLKSAFGGKPITGICRVNAGAIPASSWQQDAEAGGGRIIGELCHFIDLFQFITGSMIKDVFATQVADGQRDNVSVQLTFADGSQASIIYTSAGAKSLPKERIEVFGNGSAAVIDNWQNLDLHAPNGRNITKGFNAQKGHAEELQTFITAIKNGGEPPISWAELENTTLATFAVHESLDSGLPVSI